MRIFLLQSFIHIILLTDTIYSLPVLNFTNSVLTNRMIEALSEALIARDRQKPLKTFQKTRQHNFDNYPSYKQDFADQQHQPYPYYQPSYAEQYHQPLEFQPAQTNEHQQATIHQQQYPSYLYQQVPEYQYLPSYSMQSPEQHPQPSYAMPVPEPQASFHQVQPPAQQLPTYQNQPPEQPQQPQQQQHNFYPQNVFDAQVQHTFYPQNVFDTQAKPQQPVAQPPPVIEQPVAQQPQLQSHIPPPIEVLPQPQQLHPIAIEPQQHQPQQQQGSGDHSAAGAGFFYPYPYHNVNWYNFQQVWPQVPGGQVDLKSPAVAVAVPTNNAGTGDCPTGLCPVGASCSKYADQWQCACGQNGCSGIQNPCGIFGRYYFPYYPDATRFIQCDQTGVFWIRRCAPGTIFDPKISVCNYPPVVVETGKK